MAHRTILEADLWALPWALALVAALACLATGLAVQRRAAFRRGARAAAGAGGSPAAGADLDPADLTPVETAALRAMEDELLSLRSAAAACPWPAWHRRADGCITWANRAYLALERAVAGPDAAPVWPPRAVFRDCFERGAAGVAASRRAEITLADGGRRVFDCHAVATEGGAMCHAAPAEAARAAEHRLERIAAAFAETFARIDAGLALFDANGRLQAFNPALSEMTGLSSAVLGANPSLGEVLDRMRSAGLVPENGGGAAWRERAEAIAAAAAGGTLREIWTLPGGRAWRVTGRPRADGALCLQIEDVTAETRAGTRLRGEMALGQALVDTMEGAVCVFDASGALALANRGYAALWDVDPRRLTGDATLAEAMRRWRVRALPGAAWEALEAATAPGGAPWEGDALLRDGRLLACAAIPLGGGATLMRFEETGRRTPLSVAAAEPAHA